MCIVAGCRVGSAPGQGIGVIRLDKAGACAETGWWDEIAAFCNMAMRNMSFNTADRLSVFWYLAANLDVHWTVS
jgi:hypothetical protein